MNTDNAFTFGAKFADDGKETNSYASNFCPAIENQMTPQHHREQPVFPTHSSGLLHLHENSQVNDISSSALAKALSTLSADKNRRPRGEKKPIPEEQKDDKYYERRRRNNDAAKKSRDTRKQREDQLATRASCLERDNSVLRVQILSMREEAKKLKELWIKKCQGLALSCQLQQNFPQSRGNGQTQMPNQNHASFPLPGR
ncbi:hypothetical protein Btru_065442 [Bulinus truncatus]|nr:hypothetical protein Btru_065442 [Bulinus truncatus]